ncbi:MAG: flavin reductase family protein [Lachnospiraceae bacterium]|uniref:Flavin reductase family protein n=1 Tax=Candidatus Weimeria bifida TaxID=2599074 RepID=A0A6N7J237_9FIRM|nr:flavin reductase family protein [Candidatus Weimeria bifida]RRF96802.1 MAG: flavin reductase family protein [Lachnospiraceae bacterium]
MKKKINITGYANQIIKAIPEGVLLNTKADKFDTMIIGWGALGTNWGVPCFTAYVRKSRFTREQLDKNPEFTVSVPLNGSIKKIFDVCGSKSGRDIDKVKEAGLTLEEPETNGVPGIKEYPLTLECRLRYRQEQELSLYDDEAKDSFYKTSENDTHITYIGEIVDAYIIE